MLAGGKRNGNPGSHAGPSTRKDTYRTTLRFQPRPPRTNAARVVGCGQDAISCERVLTSDAAIEMHDGNALRRVRTVSFVRCAAQSWSLAPCGRATIAGG